MCRVGNSGWLGLAVLGSSAIAFTGAALAGPLPIASRGAYHTDSHAFHPVLDLRPSRATLNAADTLSAADKPSASFPSSRHSRTPSAQEDIRLPELGSDGSQPRSGGRAEEFVQRAHREGLPLARLWENKSALVSLGLNQKGKPGLWIIQKIH
jgi:hypothetical protein